MGTGASRVVALSLIGLRGRTQYETTQLSGMAQSVGYLLASAGPIGAGYLAEGTGGWTVPLLLIVLLATVQIAVAVPAAGVVRSDCRVSVVARQGTNTSVDTGRLGRSVRRVS